MSLCFVPPLFFSQPSSEPSTHLTEDKTEGQRDQEGRTWT